MSIYLDNSATTKVRDEVRKAMIPYIGEKWGNPSSIHKLGRHARGALDTAREQLATLLHCLPEEITFTPCATYSNNLAIIGRAQAIGKRGEANHIVTSVIEHPSVAGPIKFLEGQGWEVTYLPVKPHGRIDINAFRSAIKAHTRIVSVMWANNEIGSLQPIDEIGAECRRREIFFHTDAVQVPGKLPIDVQKAMIDCLALSGHKFYAPKGIGAMYLRKGIEVKPLFFGGGQESGLFPGTEGLSNIVAMGKAAELAQTELDATMQSLRALQTILIEGLSNVPGLKFTGGAELEHRLPGHISFVVPGIQGEAAVMQCDLKGLMVSSASACKKGIVQASHVVTALGILEEDALGSLRVTAGRFNSEAECLKAVEILRSVISKLQQNSVSQLQHS